MDMDAEMAAAPADLTAGECFSHGYGYGDDDCGYHACGLIAFVYAVEICLRGLAVLLATACVCLALHRAEAAVPPFGPRLLPGPNGERAM